jgi:hypothetical protein
VLDGSSVAVCPDDLAPERRHWKCQRTVAAPDIQRARAVDEPSQNDLRKDEELLMATRKPLVARLTPKIAWQQGDLSIHLGGS